MYAIGSCITATANANTALMGVQLTQFEVALESVVDLHGIFALADVRPGIGELRAMIRIAGDADVDTLRRIAQQGFRASPIRDSVENGVPIQPDIQVER